MLADPIPFRIRVGVLAAPDTGGPDNPDDFGRKLLGILEEDLALLLDKESRLRLDQAVGTALGVVVITTADDALANGLLDSLALPDDFRRSHTPVASTDLLSAGERLIDECDVLLVLCSEAPSESMLRSPEDRVLAYAARRGRPVIGMWTKDGSTATIARGGIGARSISRIDLYNTWPGTAEDSAAYSDSIQAELFGVAGDGAPGDPDHAGALIPDANRDIVGQFIIPHYMRASTLSKHFQDVYFKTARRVYGLSVAAVGLVAAGAILHPISAVAFGLELVVLIAILTMIRRAHRNRAHEKWLESRFLTERLRHAMHLVACGVQPVHHRIPPHVGGHEPPDLWMVMVFQEVCNRIPDLSMCDERSCSQRGEFARRVWVGGQLDYHRRTRANLERTNTVLERAGLWMFSAALLAAATHLAILGAHALHLEWNEPAWFEGGLIWLALVLPAAGAAIGGFRAHREFSRLARRSAAMVAALEDMEAGLEGVSSPTDLASMLAQIEEWMVDETQGWLMLLGPLKLEAA